MEEKIKKLEDSISLQLGNFEAGDNVKIPLLLFIDNNSTEAMNKVEVDSIEEAEKICYRITNTKNLDNRITNDEEKKFLTLVAYLPMNN